MRRRAIFIVLWGCGGLLCLSLPADTRAADSPQSRASLRGLSAFNVVVEQFRPPIEARGLTQQVLQSDVELRLRQAGVVVSGDAPVLLYANIAIVCNQIVCAYNINLEVHQAVQLAARPEPGPRVAVTWNTGAIGLLSRRLHSLRDRLKDQVDLFLNAYGAANPK